MGRVTRTVSVLMVIAGVSSGEEARGQSPGYDLLVSSRATNSVKRYDGVTGEYVDDFIAPGAGGLGSTQEVLFAPNGNLIVSGFLTDAILEFHPKTGAFLGDFTSGYALRNPTKMSWGPDGDLYVSQWAGSNKVARFDGATGAFVAEVTPSLDRAMQPAWDADGSLYVAIFGSGEVRRFGSGSQSGTVFTTGWSLQGPVNLWFDPTGSLTVVDWTAGTLERFDGSTGAHESRYVEGLTNPEGWAYGPDGRLYVADWTGQRVNAYDMDSGAFQETFASGGGLGDPNGLLFVERFPDFSLAVSGSSLSVASGGSGQVQVTIIPDRDLPFDEPVQLSCAGLHSTASCSFSPSSLTPGDSTATAVLTIAATSTAGTPGLTIALLVGLLVAAFQKRSRIPMRRPALAALTLLVCGCGSDRGPMDLEHETVTRSVSIQASAGDITHSAALSLTLTGVTQ